MSYFYSGTTSPEREGENYRKQKKDDDENLKPKLSKYQERRRKAQMQFNKYAGKDEMEDYPPAKGELFGLRSCNVLPLYKVAHVDRNIYCILQSRAGNTYPNAMDYFVQLLLIKVLTL